mmetsp:Transcript_93734/g.264632  ORF Transcript_93734/g.264632 Transcript_93734/m.264632 type:complete len:684 (-) Transcript_93734:143-2194(-)
MAVATAAAAAIAAAAGVRPQNGTGYGATKCFEVHPEDGGIALVRVRDPEAKDALEWVARVLRADGLAWVLREPGQAQATAILEESLLKALPPPKNADIIERGWCSMRVSSPKEMPGDPLALEAIAELSGVLGGTRVATRALLTAGMGRLLLGNAQLPTAVAVLVRAGHAVGLAPAMVPRCLPPPPATLQSLEKERMRHVGVWALRSREQPVGTLADKHTDDSCPLRLQCPSGYYVEARIPSSSSSTAWVQHASCGGRHAVMEDDGRIFSVRGLIVGFQPPSPVGSEYQLSRRKAKFDDEHLTLCEVTMPHPDGSVDSVMETWARLENANAGFVALELHAEESLKPRPAGLWLFAGKHFLRVIGLQPGHGVVAGVCCRSLGDLVDRFRGEEAVKAELHRHYDAVQGLVEAPGVLRVKRRALATGGSVAIAGGGEIFFDATTRVGGTITVEDGFVTHHLADGGRQKWRVVEWGYDPFTPKATPPSSAPKGGAGGSVATASESLTSGGKAKRSRSSSSRSSAARKASGTNASRKADIKAPAAASKSKPMPPTGRADNGAGSSSAGSSASSSPSASGGRRRRAASGSGPLASGGGGGSRPSGGDRERAAAAAAAATPGAGSRKSRSRGSRPRDRRGEGRRTSTRHSDGGRKREARSRSRAKSSGGGAPSSRGEKAGSDRDRRGGGRR